MLGYVLAVVVVGGLLWWLWKLGEAYFPGSGKLKFPFSSRITKFVKRSGHCSVCGIPESLALQVKAGKRHCPHVGWGRCPYDPRRGVYRTRR